MKLSRRSAVEVLSPTFGVSGSLAPVPAMSMWPEESEADRLERMDRLEASFSRFRAAQDAYFAENPRPRRR